MDFLHNCLRPALLHLQRRGMGDLNGLGLSVVYGYSLKNSGVTLAASRGVEKYLRNGHGRWLLLSSNPPEMVERYVQASLDDRRRQAIDKGERTTCPFLLLGRVLSLLFLLHERNSNCSSFTIAPQGRLVIKLSFEVKNSSLSQCNISKILR